MRHCLLIALIVLSSVSYAASVADVLSQTGKAYRELSYRGIVTYEFGASIQSLELTHGVIDGHEYETLATLNGEPFELVRAGHHISCIHPGDDLLRSGNTLPTSILGSYGDLRRANSARNYSVYFKGKARVAGRPASLVVVHANDKFRYGYKFYIDDETNLVLKRLTFNSERKVFERFQFVDIEFLEQLPDTFAVAAKQAAAKQFHARTDDTQYDTVIRATWLPDGFVLSGSRGDSLTQLATYSDGLASVTVVLEPASPRTEGLRTDGRARRGATVAYTRPVLVAGQPYVLTVLGEVPIMTAAKISRHLRLQ